MRGSIRVRRDLVVDRGTLGYKNGACGITQLHNMPQHVQCIN